MISSRTKLIGLLGMPLSFSFAPAMQNGAYEAVGLDYLYLPIECGKENLADILCGVRQMNFAGLAVTKPLKIEMVRELDEIDPLTGRIGAVNTVVIKNGRFIGYNTDGIGFTQGLHQTYGDFAGKKMFVFGAGGASRAVCFSAASERVGAVFLTDPMEAAAVQLAESLAVKTGVRCEVVFPGTDDFMRRFTESDIVVNASGIGMAPYEGESPAEEAWFSPSQFVCDLCYNPPETQFLRQAYAAGCHCMDGLEMSVIQGAYQFELWTEHPAPLSQMRASAQYLSQKTKKAR